MLLDVPRLCVSLDAATAADARGTVHGLPQSVELVELRLDRFLPGEVKGDEWTGLAGEGGREWICTWRSPSQGGARPRPREVWTRALASGFAWVDVEAACLDAGDPEAIAIPPSRRWVSRHLPRQPRTAAEVREAWRSLARHEGALHKLVIPVEDFAANDWILDVQAEAARTGPVSVFGMGWTGHPSRVLGALGGNAVTFLSPGKGRETAPGQLDLELALEVHRLQGMEPRPHLYGVLGHPVRHSRSPELHRRAFRARGTRALYMLLDAPAPGGILEWVRRGRLRGVSVTSPFKEAVLAGVDRPEPAAEQIGAVNTVWGEEGLLWGANTDAEAAAEMLAASPEGAVAILGAGGAARAVAVAARQGGREVSIFHRDPGRGGRVASSLGATWGGSWVDLHTESFAVVVNATPVGGKGPVPDAIQDRRWRGRVFLDLPYHEGPSAWEGWVRDGGGEYRGGLEFLARQAVGQQRRWTGGDVPLSVFLPEGGA
jgi:shikimate dehydrogenase/3-dehydroquinate dehydratase type I